MIPDLRDIWAQDRNGDGIVDYLNARIYVPDVPTPQELAAAANIAARLAFETTSMDLPIGFRVSEYVASEAVSIFVGRAAAGQSGPRTITLPTVADAEAFARKPAGSPYRSTHSRNSPPLVHESGERVERYGFPKRLSLASLFTKDFLLRDADGDFIPEMIDTTVVIGADVRSTAVIDLAARIALESAGLRLPLVVCAISTADLPPPNAVLIGRTNPHIQELIRTGKAQSVDEPGRGRIQVVDSFVTIQGRDAAGEDEALRYVAHCLPGLRTYGKGRASLSTLEDQVRRHTHTNPPKQRVVFEEEFEVDWELEEVRRKIQSLVLSRVRSGAAVQLDVRVSEPPEIRSAFASELRELLQAHGADLARSDVRVLCAHKQGFGWIDEILKPRLKATDTLRVAYRELTLEPNSVDSRTRWLEELYPIDEVLARDVGIPQERTTFHALPTDSPMAYEVVVENAVGEVTLHASFEPRSVLRPLFDAFTNYATATVSTGGFRAVIDEEVIADERVATDYERFWDGYQSRILPRIHDYVMQLHWGKPNPERAPHFAELRIDVELSEPDLDLGIDQERLSTLEALHEDLYFETLLFFEVLGTHTSGRPLRYPGRIIPIVRAATGKAGRARVSLSGYDAPMPERMFPQSDPLITAIDVQSGKGVVSVEVTVAETQLCWLLSNIEETALPPASKPESPIVKWDKPIGPKECEQLISQLASFPEVRPFCAGITFLGQPVWAVDVLSPVDGKYFSQAKAYLSKPCLFLTGRQHANEVSSTSHILRFVELLATSPEHRALLQRVNFIIQPITNPDGAALVDELYPRMPGFMLHACYLGALGVDMTEGQWENCPRYPEARVRTDLWRMWLPDIVLNPHGYPSHEWVQLFAGYTAWVHSREFTARDWWIPRGWFIPRFDWIQDYRYPGHALAALMLKDGIAQAVDRAFGDVNQRMYRRYAKYTGDSLPLHDRVLIYAPAKGGAPNPRSQGFMMRHPQVTFFEGLSEAPDEIAVGKWLNAIAAVGLEATLVHARFLAEMPHETKRLWWEEDGNLYLTIENTRRLARHRET